jgi:hypothetical protein
MTHVTMGGSSRRKWDLAQVNIARLLEQLDSHRLSGFVQALGEVNAAADAAPGFVWRLQSEDGNATSIRAFEWDTAGSAGVIVNLSTWESAEALSDYVYAPAHRDVLRRRREWFHHVAEPTTVLWWVPLGHRPTAQEAEQSLVKLRHVGPSPEAFLLSEPFPPPTESA